MPPPPDADDRPADAASPLTVDAAGAAPVTDHGAVPLRLRPPRHQVDRRAIWLWSAHAGMTALAGLVAVTAAVALVEPVRDWWPVAGGITGALGAVYVAAMPRIRFRVHRWEVTDDAVYAKAGWLTHEWRVAPLSRVQTVDARRGPLQQLLGLASVHITTASAAGEVAVDGLDHMLAADLVQTLTERTQATPGDAT